MNAPFWVTQQVEVAFSTALPLQVIRGLVQQHQVDVRAWANSEHGPSQMPFRWACKRASPEWKCEFVEWLLDECGYPLNGTYSVLRYGDTTQKMSLLDFLVWRPGLGCARVFSMVRRRGGQFMFGMRRLLSMVRVQVWDQPRDFEERCEFLLDCGTVPVYDISECISVTMYESRCKARRRAIAMLSMRRKRPDLHGVVPRELWERMARYLWSLRFCCK